MIKNKIICLVVCICMIGTQAYASSDTVKTEDIKSNLEKMYGINIVIPEYENSDFLDCIQVLERSLNKFPENIIKEITDYYRKNGIATNVIIDKTENLKDLFSDARIEDTTNIYIRALESSLYSDTCFVPGEAVIHEIGYFISNYLFETYDFGQLKTEFEKLNKGYKYGTWSSEHSNIFVSKHSATSFEDEISDLIWYAEAHPSVLRNIKGGDTAIIHKKIKLLASVLEQNFESISQETKLWIDAVPQQPDNWAKDTINEMQKLSLLPEEFTGVYESYIVREDFYKLVTNLLHKKIGEKNFKKYFGQMKFEERLAIDPVNGKVFVNDEVSRQEYPVEILNSEFFNNPEGYMTRLEIVKALIYIGSKLGMDITDYTTIDFQDITEVEEIERPYIYLASSKGFLQGDGLNIKPHDYCTYQETYIILMRFYNIV